MPELERVQVFDANPFLAFHGLKFARVFDGSDLSICRIDVAPNQYSRPHLHRRDVYVMVIACRDTGVWTLTGDQLRSYTWHGMYDMIRIPADVPHCVSNPTPWPLSAIEIRTARIEDDNILIKELEPVAERQHRQLARALVQPRIVDLP